MGWKGRERQCGNGPHPSVLIDINHLEIRSLFTKLSLGEEKQSKTQVV